MLPLLQSGALAYRKSKSGLVELLVIKKRRSQNWGIPKGKLSHSISEAENAAKEAFEEAGVRGNIGERPLGSYRAFKSSGDQKILIEVSVYLLEVTSIAKDWPEKNMRETRWCPPTEAAQLLREPLLVQLCQNIEYMLSRGQVLRW